MDSIGRAVGSHPMSARQHEVCAQVDVPSTNHALLSADVKPDNEHLARQQHAVHLPASIYCLYALQMRHSKRI